jgi:hypothetical protein
MDECAPWAGTCVLLGTVGWCVQPCDLGSAPASKCHARQDQACSGLYDTDNRLIDAACLPMCASDAQCGSRKCDPTSGYCTDALPPSPPLGGACNENDTNDPCTSAGRCFAGECIELCRYGSSDGCGFRSGALDAAAGTFGGCVSPWDDPANGTSGDLGFCLQACETSADCLAPGMLCDPTYRAAWQHGMCVPPSADAGTPADATTE